MMIWQAH